jgi:hypothetical protein
MVQFPCVIKIDVISLASRKVKAVKPRNVRNFANGALPKRADAFMLEFPAMRKDQN